MSVVRKLPRHHRSCHHVAAGGRRGARSGRDPPSGGFADAMGIIVDLTVLTQIPVPGPFGGSPIDPNTFSTASQSRPPNAGQGRRKVRRRRALRRRRQPLFDTLASSVQRHRCRSPLLPRRPWG